MTSIPTPFDLPETLPVDSTDNQRDQITAIISENNKYGFTTNDIQYNWEECAEKLDEKLRESNISIRKIKIAGHKDARYESIFQPEFDSCL